MTSGERWSREWEERERQAAPVGGAAVDIRDGGVLVHRIAVRSGHACLLACRVLENGSAPVAAWGSYFLGARDAPIRRVDQEIDCMACIATGARDGDS